MPKRPTESRRKSSGHQHTSSHTTADKHPQHGSPLLDLPQESLTRVTSYLSPRSLFALARTCRYLCEHVDDDYTWLRAFLNQLLGFGPEYHLEGGRILLLKRTENTWRKEFILHHDVRQRWQRSRNPTVTHTPQHSSIDGVHLISRHGILTSSIQYGIVARSILLNGKVLKGYIDASGTGLSIGNPNVEFTPNVSACAMSSDGGTARVFWGKRDGKVALTVVNQVMDSRAASKFMRCGVNEQHEGAVHHIIPDSDTNTFLSAGADGRVKLWGTKTLQRLWSTDKQQLSLVTDPFVSVAGSLSDGFVAGALKSGSILLYNLHKSETLVDDRRVCSTHHLRLLPPIHSESSQPEQQIAKTWLYRTGDTNALLLVQYTDHPQFFRICADIRSRDVAITSFGDSSFGSVTTLEPVISTHPHDANILIAGDLLGFVSIYNADAPQTSVAPVHRFEAHTDGSVTAISWSPTVFATGSARGTTVVWDSLTLEPMRYFTTPAPRPAPGHDWDAVSQISIDKDLVVIVVGNRVMSWNAGGANVRAHPHKKVRHANTKISVTTKGHQRYEMDRDIAESYMELEHERAHVQRRYGCERGQRSTLVTLGLSELEAVEYVLMLSREEEEARQQRKAVEEDVFEGEFDNSPDTPASSRFRRPTPSPPRHASRRRRSNGHQDPHVSLTVPNKEARVSPPCVPKPMEAGASIRPLRSLTIEPGMSPGPVMATRSTSSSLDDFPSISSSLSSTSSSKRGMPASPDQPRSAWSTPLKSLSPSPTLSSSRSRVVTPARSSNTPFSVNITQRRAADGGAEEMDSDLRLAIELSLAETQSREENV